MLAHRTLSVLLQVEGLDPCRARALYESGLKTPNDVLKASDEALKKALTTEPILALPDPDRPYTIHTDFSHHAVSAILEQ